MYKIAVIIYYIHVWCVKILALDVYFKQLFNQFKTSFLSDCSFIIWKKKKKELNCWIISMRISESFSFSMLNTYNAKFISSIVLPRCSMLSIKWPYRFIWNTINARWNPPLTSNSPSQILNEKLMKLVRNLKMSKSHSPLICHLMMTDSNEKNSFVLFFFFSLDYLTTWKLLGQE